MTALATPLVPISWGELVDKLTILEIKQARITRVDARANVEREHARLQRIGQAALAHAGMPALVAELRRINEDLWDIEDAIREEEAAARFGKRFIALARSVYRRNDERARVKRRINDLLGSDLVEEKSYASFAPNPASSAPPAVSAAAC